MRGSHNGQPSPCLRDADAVLSSSGISREYRASAPAPSPPCHAGPSAAVAAGRNVSGRGGMNNSLRLSSPSQGAAGAFRESGDSLGCRPCGSAVAERSAVM
ncbi:hypothetical protein MATL_G00049510 [Megalops atlanticus]|uniref:Uncharacterized protein n=1 Tax=Megalops atlanticus TaxID=7932 RepID=A0A9D3QDS8_MEGAT|nr:hypothetical protein MATL_G00049510 [Megalops atlanticus]